MGSFFFQQDLRQRKAMNTFDCKTESVRDIQVRGFTLSWLTILSSTPLHVVDYWSLVRDIVLILIMKSIKE